MRQRYYDSICAQHQPRMGDRYLDMISVWISKLFQMVKDHSLLSYHKSLQRTNVTFPSVTAHKHRKLLWEVSLPLSISYTLTSVRVLPNFCPSVLAKTAGSIRYFKPPIFRSNNNDALITAQWFNATIFSFIRHITTSDANVEDWAQAPYRSDFRKAWTTPCKHLMTLCSWADVRHDFNGALHRPQIRPFYTPCHHSRSQ